METKTNMSVVRNTSFQKGGIGIRERHNERLNESYNNPDIRADRMPLNIRFKECETTYEKAMGKMVESGAISLRGLKPNAKVFGELVFDVNTQYFEDHGGYEFAKRFYEEAFRFAEREIGRDYILSAIMHADEVHRGIQHETGKELYHYHLHVTYIPVVQKEIKWSKRCKDKSLVGKTKEIINQVSNSKKWAFVEAKDADGNTALGKNGKPIMIPSYSILQDKFYEHMVGAGFKGFERGERGSTAKHLTVIEYKTEKAKERLTNMEEKITKEELRLDTILADRQDVEKINAYADEISRVGRFNDSGLIEVTENQYRALTTLAREGLYSRKAIQTLKGEVELWKTRFAKAVERIKGIYTETREMRVAFRIIPEKMKAVIEDVFTSNRKLAEEKKDVDVSLVNLEISDLYAVKNINKTREDVERF